jgi:hypothetical protein
MACGSDTSVIHLLPVLGVSPRFADNQLSCYCASCTFCTKRARSGKGRLFNRMRQFSDHVSICCCSSQTPTVCPYFVVFLLCQVHEAGALAQVCRGGNAEGQLRQGSRQVRLPEF